MNEFTFFCMLLLVGGAVAEEDYQLWSEKAYEGEPHSFYCNDTFGRISVNPGDKLSWHRHGHSDPIMTNNHYELHTKMGIENMELKITKVTGDTSGIYFCYVDDTNGQSVGRIIKAINIGGHKYHDYIDKYRENIIVGAIAGGAVFVVIVGVCAIDNFRYLTDEQKQKRRERKEHRTKQQQQEQQDGGYVNMGVEMVEKNGLNDINMKQAAVDTHL